MTLDHRILQPEELEQLFAKLDNPYRAIAQLSYWTGGRIGEVLKLRVDNVTEEQIVFEVTKTG